MGLTRKAVVLMGHGRVLVGFLGDYRVEPWADAVTGSCENVCGQPRLSYEIVLFWILGSRQKRKGQSLTTREEVHARRGEKGGGLPDASEESGGVRDDANALWS